jgi:interferon gamma-inducible protein 30
MKFTAIAALAGAVSAYKTNDKIMIDLFYESECPYCRDQIIGNFNTAYNTPGFSDMATVTLHPYGNAHESQNSNGEWVFSCQHGPVECTYNTLEACALDKIPDAFPFIKCIEDNARSSAYDDVAKSCATKTNVSNVDDILTCYKGAAGNALQHKIAMTTEALNPPHKYVPWMVVDGQHTDDIQNALGDNMVQYVCKNYKGANKAAACSQDFELSTKDIEVTYADEFPGVMPFTQ